MKPIKIIAIGSMGLLSLALPLMSAKAMGNSSSSPSISGSPGKSIEKKVERLTTALSLSSDEQAKISAILEQESAAIKGLRADKSLSKTDHSAKLKVIHSETKTKIAALLSPDQQKKFADMGPGRRSSVANKT